MAPKRGKATYQKILATRAANVAARAQADVDRYSDPFEAARRHLQKLGYNVYPESILGGSLHASKLYVVGKLRLTRTELMEYAAKLTGDREC